MQGDTMQAGTERQMLQGWIEATETRHFRTPYDTGANPNAMMLWNMLRTYAGMPPVTMTDLIERHAAANNISVEEQAEKHIAFRKRKSTPLIRDEARLAQLRFLFAEAGVAEFQGEKHAVIPMAAMEQALIGILPDDTEEGTGA